MACIIKRKQDHIEAYDLAGRFVFSADNIFEAYYEAVISGYTIVQKGDM